jgi:hypothetical protein
VTHPMERLNDAQRRALQTIQGGRVTSWKKHGLNPRTVDRLERMGLVKVDATGKAATYRERGVTRVSYEFAYRVTDRGRAELAATEETK